MAAITLTSANFEEEVLKSDVPVLVDFWASWCGPCKMLGPMVEQVAEESDGSFKVGKVNVDDEPELAQKYAVMSIPTVMFFKDGELLDKKVGVMPPQEFVKVIEANV